MHKYQGVSLDALRNRAAKRVASEEGGGPAAKVAKGARVGEAEAEAGPPAGPAEADWLDCVPEVPEEAEEAAAAAAAVKAAALPVKGEQLEVEVAEAGGAVVWKAAEVLTLALALALTLALALILTLDLTLTRCARSGAASGGSSCASTARRYATTPLHP